MIIGALSIPDQMPTISQQNEENPQEASDRVSREHNKTIIHSKGFLLAMIGTAFVSLGIICIIIIRCTDDSDTIIQPQARIQPEVNIIVEPKVQAELKSILKVKVEVKPESKAEPKIIKDMYSKPRPHITMLKFPHKNESINVII